MRVTLLGTGTSTGVPLIGCACQVCTSSDPRDKRRRVSVLLQSAAATVLIDTSADFRQQMLDANVSWVDAVFYTHHHYDHIAGFDDLRAFQFLHRKAPTCYATPITFEHIKRTFLYAFEKNPSPLYALPDVPFKMLDGEFVSIKDLTIEPLELVHGDIISLGFRSGRFAYLTDCNAIPDDTLKKLAGLDTLVLDGLRIKTHPTHLSINEAIEYASRIGARMTYLTHMNHDVLHEKVERSMPPNVRLAYDGLTFDL